MEATHVQLSAQSGLGPVEAMHYYHCHHLSTIALLGPEADTETTARATQFGSVYNHRRRDHYAVYALAVIFFARKNGEKKPDSNFL